MAEPSAPLPPMPEKPLVGFSSGGNSPLLGEVYFENKKGGWDRNFWESFSRGNGDATHPPLWERGRQRPVQAVERSRGRKQPLCLGEWGQGASLSGPSWGGGTGLMLCLGSPEMGSQREIKGLGQASPSQKGVQLGPQDSHRDPGEYGGPV